MSLNKGGLLALIAVLFAVTFLGIVVAQRSRRGPSETQPAVALERFGGALSVQAVDDLRVDGRRVLLCGVAFTKPQSMRPLVTDVARKNYEGLAVKCRQVGTGTPCDGKVASKFGDSIVVQCFMPDGTDLALKLAQDGILCGRPAQADKTYPSC